MKTIPYIFLILILCVGCMHKKHDDVKISNILPENFAPLSDLEIGNTENIPQIIAGRYKQKHMKAQGVLSLSKDSLNLIALTPISRLFTLSYSKNNELNFHSEMSDFKKIKSEYILLDLQLVYWSKSSLEKAFGANYTIYDKGLSREVFLNNIKIASIEYSSLDKLHSDIKYENLRYDYSYKIEMQK